MATKKETAKEATKKVVVNAHLLNVRKTPSLKAKIVDVLKKDTKLSVLEEKDGFYKIANGWVKAEFTKEI